MDQDRARSLLITERDEVQGLLKDAETAGQGDRQAEVDSEAEDEADAALALTEEGEDDAIAENLRNRLEAIERADRKSTRLNSSHPSISYAVFCLKKKKKNKNKQKKPLHKDIV